MLPVSGSVLEGIYHGLDCRDDGGYDYGNAYGRKDDSGATAAR